MLYYVHGGVLALGSCCKDHRKDQHTHKDQSMSSHENHDRHMDHRSRSEHKDHGSWSEHKDHGKNCEQNIGRRCRKDQNYAEHIPVVLDSKNLYRRMSLRNWSRVNYHLQLSLCLLLLSSEQ